MAKSLAVAIVHGMGSQGPSYAENMIRELDDRVDGIVSGGASRIAWRPIYWADILEGKELAYLRKAERENDLDYRKLRKFVVTALGDAVGYRQPLGTYRKIHQRVKAALQSLYRSQLGSQPVPLVVIAHSLGCHIMSNYIWDAQQGTSHSKYEDMEWLAGFITCGCNMPLFTFAYDNVKPIRFPGRRIPSNVKPKAKWLNYYDPDDILGYPLRSINDAYKRTVTKDVSINVGGFLSSWNPASHTQYWTDNDFTKPVAKYLASLL